MCSKWVVGLGNDESVGVGSAFVFWWRGIFCCRSCAVQAGLTTNIVLHFRGAGMGLFCCIYFKIIEDKNKKYIYLKG